MDKLKRTDAGRAKPPAQGYNPRLLSGLADECRASGGSVITGQYVYTLEPRSGELMRMELKDYLGGRRSWVSLGRPDL